MENYSYQVESFMLNDLHLRGTDLLLFALCYSYYKQGKYCKLSQKQLAKMTGCSDRSIRSSIKRLCLCGNLVYVPGTDMLDVLISMEVSSSQMEKSSYSNKKVTKELTLNDIRKQKELERLIEIAKVPWITED